MPKSLFPGRFHSSIKGKCLPHILDNIDMIHAKKIHFRGIWAVFEVYY